MTHVSVAGAATGTGAPMMGVMKVWVVRHGCAGHKHEWPGDDDRRPLDRAGRQQADALVSLLGGLSPRRLRASPARRCVDTLGPLAGKLGLPVETTDRLRPDGYPGGLLALVDDDTMPGDVLCTHGEVMLPTLHELRSRRATTEDEDRLLRKGAVWELDLEPMSLVLHTPAATSTCPDHR
jgi:phosphohistidine phosphatase SixA